MSTGAYRPEVDGLRGIAVLSVILFHAGFAPFSGGFVGVDVFFVISGFLITSILLDEQQQGLFSFAGFYARRARRILPALAVVLLACAPVAWLLLTRTQAHDFFRALVATALFHANFFYAHTTGYFDAPAEWRPLLHTWSLSVEEQYYFVLPLLLTLCWRGRPGRAAPVFAAALALLAAASLAFSEWGARHFQGANFFLSFGRAWELLAGSLAALYARLRGPGRDRTAPWLAGLGLLGVIGSVGLFDRSTPSPSAWLLVPAAGTALVLVHGQAGTGVGRLLAWRGLVGVGLVSYSAYLWHQPLLAFARVASPEPLSDTRRLGLVLLTFGLAYPTWRWVEQAFRRRQASQRTTLLVALAVSLGLVAVGLAGQATLKALQPKEPASVQAAFHPPERAAQCLDIAQAHSRADGWFCTLNPAGSQRPSFFVLGDSHGLQLVSAFDMAAQFAGRTGQFAGFSGCAPLLGVYPLTRADQASYDCHALNQRVLAHVKAQGIKELFLVAKWSYYTNPWNGTAYLNALGLSPGDVVSVDRSRQALRQGLMDTVAAYRQWGVRLHIVEQVPQQARAPEAVYRRAWAEPGNVQQQLDTLAVPLAQHRALQRFTSELFGSLRGQSGIDLVNLDALFCNAQLCRIGTPATPYYQDISHLSDAGAALTIPLFTAILKEHR